MANEPDTTARIRSRLYVEDDLRAGETLSIETRAAHHLLHVLRLKSGDVVALFNGRDGEFTARLEVSGKSKALAHVGEQLRAQTPHPDLVYAFAPLKQARLDYMVQKAVEMGAGTLQPVFTERTQVPRLKLERIVANAREAAEQCGALSLPEIAEPLKLTPFLEDWNQDRVLIFCDEAADAASPVATLQALVGRRLGVLIGPEGGFTPKEREMLLARKNCLPISLGPRILRADTAAVAALALVQTLTSVPTQKGV